MLGLSLACLDPKEKKEVPESVAREIALMTLGLPSGASVDKVRDRFGTLFQSAQNPPVVLRAYKELEPDTVGCNKPIVPKASSSLVHSEKEQRVALDTTRTTTPRQKEEEPGEKRPHL